MLQVISSNSQRFSSQNQPARSPPEKNQSPLIGEKKTLRDSGSRRGSLYSGWGKDSKSWGVRHTKSSLARRKVVEMMMATGNVHSHCHYPKTRTSKPYAITWGSKQATKLLMQNQAPTSDKWICLRMKQKAEEWQDSYHSDLALPLCQWVENMSVRNKAIKILKPVSILLDSHLSGLDFKKINIGNISWVEIKP